MGWADTEKFVAATAKIDHTYFRTNGWAEETTPSTCGWSNGELTVSMTESKNEQWQAQVFLDTKITYDASKQYDISFDIITTNGVGGIMVKLGNTGTLYAETITTGASVLQHYAKQNVQGVAANDGMLIFDFGYAPANTDVTISNISIIEKEPVITPYCQRATGHLGDPNFGDANGRILLTITKLSNSSVGVKVEPNNNGADVFDFVQVELNGVAKTLGAIGGSAPTTAEIVYEGLASLNFNINILWHHKTWADAGGRWTTQQFAVKEAELCPAPIESEYCGYQGSETQQDGHYFAITWETDASGNVVISIGNGTGAGACSFRNGGFEGDNNGLVNFVVSDDDFATTTPAADYFTVTRPADGDLQYVLTKVADLPANAKIKHLTAGAIAWREAGVDRWCFPEFIYTYGAICTAEPELTSIVLEASSTIAQTGVGVTLTASPLDQFGAPIEATINYAISPADAGSISGNVFTFAKTGAATITASSGTIEKSITLYGVSSANLALNKTCEAGYWDGNNSEKATAANDGNEGTAWVTWSWQDAAVEWWYVDLGALYDITAISVLWGADYSNSYILQVRAEAPAEDDKADDKAWTTIVPATSASANSFAMNYLTTTGRYVRLHSLSRPTGTACIRLRELQVFGSEAATPTKSVSASVNNPAMGTATVKQEGVDVTEVEAGSTVTFSAVANDGYIFVDWSNGETNASFDAEVNSNMNLTANFRALGTTYCNTELTNGDNTVYVTYKKTANENEYTLIVRSAKVMTNFSNAYVGHVNGNGQINMNGQGTLSRNGHMLSYTFTSTTEPGMNTPLYIMMPNEVTFSQLTNVEFAIPCADPEITAIELNQTEATLDMGNTLTLIPSFTPAYMSADITWQTSDNTIATVTNGVVTPVAPGEVTITAKISETVKATCAVTVQTAASHNWYGYGTDKDLDYTYRIEYTTDHHIVAHVKRQGDKTGLVDVGMNINNVWTTINVTEGEEEGWKKGTTAATYTAGDEITIIFQSNFSGASSIINVPYTVGADNSMPTIVPSVLKLSNDAITMGLTDEDIQLATEMHHRDAANQTIIWTSDDETVATVVNGLIHPVGVGSATITAKCQADENVSATCTVTVVGALEPATFWGNGVDGTVAIAYSITRNANHTLTYTVEAQQDKVGFVVQVNDGGWNTTALNDGIYSWTSTATYTDGDKFNGFFYMPFDGGAARVDFVNYEVGSESARRYIPITVVENADNSAVLTANDEKVREVTVTRSFTAGSLYTLVLPFDVDAAQTAENLPGTLTKLNNSYIKENGDLRINFVNVAAIEAGVPYLYEPSADVANPVFAGVTISKDLNPTEPEDGLAKYHGIYATMDGETLKALTNAYVLGSDQYLYSVADLPDTQTMSALRGYFVLNFPNNTPNGAPKPRAKVVFNSHETNTATGIEAVSEGAQCTKYIDNGMLYIIRDGKTYNVQGQLVK